MTATATLEAAPEQGAKSKKKLLLIVTVLLAVVGAAAYVLLGGSGAEAEATSTEPPAEEGAVVTVAEMTATLAGPEIHYAKLSFAAVLRADADEAAVTARFPLLRDAAITELSTMNAEVLRTTAGMDTLRERLSVRAAELYPDGEVMRAVLTELVVQ